MVASLPAPTGHFQNSPRNEASPCDKRSTQSHVEGLKNYLQIWTSHVLLLEFLIWVSHESHPAPASSDWPWYHSGSEYKRCKAWHVPVDRRSTFCSANSSHAFTATKHSTFSRSNRTCGDLLDLASCWFYIKNCMNSQPTPPNHTIGTGLRFRHVRPAHGWRAAPLPTTPLVFTLVGSLGQESVKFRPGPGLWAGQRNGLTGSTNVLSRGQKVAASALEPARPRTSVELLTG